MRTAMMVLVLLAGTVRVAGAQGLHVSLEERSLLVKVDQRPVTKLQLPIEPRQLLVRGTAAYVALGPAGLWVIDLSHPEAPTVVARLEEGKDVAGVLSGPGTSILVIENPYSVTTFDVTNPLAPLLVAPAVAPPMVVLVPPPPPVEPAPAIAVVAPPPPLPVARKPVEGKVVKLVAGVALLDKGAADGLVIGSRVEIFSSRTVARLSPKTGEVEMLPSRESVGVLVVRVADEHGATADVNRGNVVRSGDEFTETSAPITEHFVFPARQDYHHRFQAVLRPFVEVGSVGVGFISDLRYSYHFDVPAQIEVGVTPLAFEIRGGAGAAQTPTAFDVTASYDTDFFSIGLGVGSLVYSAQSQGPLMQGTPAAARFGLYQSARLGSVDGLSLQVRNSFVFREDTIGDQTPMKFEWGSTEVLANIPLNRRLSLLFNGGGGDNGWGYGEVGIRTCFAGNGGPGTIIVPIGIGVGGFTKTGTTGPMMSIGVELRN